MKNKVKGPTLVRTSLRPDVCPTTDTSDPKLLSAKSIQTAHDFSTPVVRALRNDGEYDLNFIPWMTRCKDTIGYRLSVGSYAWGLSPGICPLR